MFNDVYQQVSISTAGGDNTLEIFKSKCPFHKNMDVEFFCPKCDVPVCIYCKMVGSHSTGAFNNHRLVGVRVAWKKAIDEASEPNITILHGIAFGARHRYTITFTIFNTHVIQMNRGTIVPKYSSTL